MQAGSNWKRMIFRTGGWLGVAALLMGSASCFESINYAVDPAFSVNIIKPGSTWPKFDNMTPAKLEVYDRYGRPDYFRVWYNPNGEIANMRQAGPLIRQREVGRLPWSWVYETEEIEVRFGSPTRFEEIPLSDKLKVLCTNGDPHAPPDITELKTGSIRESWIYYDVGKQFVFIDDKLADVHRFRGMGPAMRRM
jgi:hypothetical protein